MRKLKKRSIYGRLRRHKDEARRAGIAFFDESHDFPTDLQPGEVTVVAWQMGDFHCYLSRQEQQRVNAQGEAWEAD